MTGAHRRRQSAALIAAAVVLAASSGVAQNRDTMETKVTASGSTITFEWSKKHPWDADLANGAFLFAEYRTARGAGIDCLIADSTGRGDTYARRGQFGPCMAPLTMPAGKDQRRIRFELPAQVRAVPLGDVCLFVALPNQRIVPIRQAGKDGESTSRFSYVPWAETVTASARTAVLRARRQELERAISSLEQSVANQVANNERNKWTSIDACENVTVSTFAPEEADRPVAAVAEHDRLARQVCVNKVVTAQAALDKQVDEVAARGENKSRADLTVELALISNAVQPPPVLASVLAKASDSAGDEWMRWRAPQYEVFVRDFNRFSATAAQYQREFPVAHFETGRPILRLQTLTVSAGRRASDALRTQQAPDARDLRGFVGGAIEAYDRCVSDGLRQLSVNLRSTASLSANAASLTNRVRTETMNECRADLAKVNALRAEMTKYREELAANTRELASLTPAALSSKTLVLNDAVCKP